MIRTGRLVLRKARIDDLEPLHAIFSNPLAMRYWDRPAYDDIAMTRRFLEHFMRPDPTNRYEFILERDGRCIGKAGVWAKPEVGFILHPDHWRQGLAYEALTTILPRAFAAFPNLDALTAEVDPRNAGSVRLLEKLGFSRSRIAEKDFLYGGAEWCDTAYYQLARTNCAGQSTGDRR